MLNEISIENYTYERLVEIAELKRYSKFTEVIEYLLDNYYRE